MNEQNLKLIFSAENQRLKFKTIMIQLIAVGFVVLLNFGRSFFSEIAEQPIHQFQITTPTSNHYLIVLIISNHTQIAHYIEFHSLITPRTIHNAHRTPHSQNKREIS